MQISELLRSPGDAGGGAGRETYFAVRFRVVLGLHSLGVTARLAPWSCVITT